MAVSWHFFPKSDYPPEVLQRVIAAFKVHEAAIDSATHNFESNNVLSILKPDLVGIGFTVETGKTTQGKIPVPVLYGFDGKLVKSYNADAVHLEGRVVMEVEAGRAMVNNQIYKDLFQACLMQEVDYLILCLRNDYRNSKDFKKACETFETLYVSRRLSLPLKGILVVGY